MSNNLPINQATALKPGMFVRFPLDVEEYASDFREFRIGKIEYIDTDASIATIHALVYDLDEHKRGEVSIKASEQRFERQIEQISRCRVLQNSPFQSIEDKTVRGQVLIACQDEFTPGVHLEYFVQIGDTIRTLSEAEFLVGSTRQDPDPVEQALTYEFHNPSWHHPRDHMVTAYNELHSSTFGIEDLVGSRVFLLAHQAEVIARVLSSPDCRFMLADEVGLGKTIEASVILKALRRRNPKLKALIIAPASLTHQWRNELNQKFWLDLPIVQPGAKNLQNQAGVIISTEDLAESQVYRTVMLQHHWDLVIIDEAHHLRKNQSLYDYICQLTATAPGVLILTATPIQRHAEEYLALLRLLDPQRYRTESVESFRRLLDAQQPIRAAITLTQSLLNTDDVDTEEFVEELEPLGDVLGDDTTLVEMLNELATLEDSPEDARELAQQIVAYVSTNYRIESRIIRNRRANLQLDLPQRILNTQFSYTPTGEESQLLDELYDYAQSYVNACNASPIAIEYVRILLHSAASSPQVLCELLNLREESLRQPSRQAFEVKTLLGPAAPRQEAQRQRYVIAAAPAPANERDTIRRLARQAELWREETDQLIASVRLSTINTPKPNRITQCLRAAYLEVNDKKNAKVLIFTNWVQTATLIVKKLRSLLGHAAVVQFTADMSEADLQDAVTRFQSEDDCSILVCDELGGEGRNFQMANCIIHTDIPWTPAQVEQRIGRVDRLGRTDDVRSIVVFAHDTLEHDLFRLWDEALELFTRSMSGMEIALEETQDQITKALARSVRQGLADLLDTVREQSAALREEVEKERLYEKETDNKELRQQFKSISDRYRDGKLIRDAVRSWTSIAGLSNFQTQGDITIYNTRNFKINSMTRARFLPPNMTEAARRIGNTRTTQIIGTFNRDLAVRREDLVFFAPGDDPWTDAVITNALESDRGRCCAVGFKRNLAKGGAFFQLLYSFQINPHYLYQARLDPIYLLHAQSYLPRPYLELLVDIDGEIMKRNDPRRQLLELPFKDSSLRHLGMRKTNEHGISAINSFRERYPADVWSDMVRTSTEAAMQFILEDVVEYAAERADDAAREFARRVAGWEAGLRWQAQHGSGSEIERPALEKYRRATQALVQGIRHHLIRLESICFWEPFEEE